MYSTTREEKVANGSLYATLERIEIVTSAAAAILSICRVFFCGLPSFLPSFPVPLPPRIIIFISPHFFTVILMQKDA